ncbi:acetylornithine deacetylase [Grosmannia clavigera kw1407]|uniref:Acetylornithine deacetylase n=1 Tax=Grosmannia clavigera (strain kw1407 / UAMH 11150) TaxID=655863 RepID=F0XQR6_GROCL|nr:acetylornithine deacetylase [Grosmannia clavigera kw1407]EFW99808.1 acetylornithine deacetylase [Grosmannia clavigera kw1407]
MRTTSLSGLLLLLASRASADFQRPQRPLSVDLADEAANRRPQTSAPPYRDDLLALHRGLVETASVTGTEADVGAWLVDYLRQRNYTAVRQAVQPRESGQKRFNVVAWMGGSSEDDLSWSSSSSSSFALPPSRVLVTSHIDVVPPHIGYAIDDAGDAITSKTAIRGRGSVDAKGSVAAQLTAVEALRRAGRVGPGDLALLYVVGEEDGGDGMVAFSASLSPSFAFQSAIFGEPTENRLACGHKGILGCTVTARGRAGHSGYPWLGRSANELLLRGLLAVVDTDLGSSPLYGATTVNIGRMAGGVAANVIPADATAHIAIRVATAPQADGHERVRTRLTDALRSVDPDPNHLDVTCGHGYGVVECNCHVEGFQTMVANYGTDIPGLAGNHTRYLYGPGSILVAHSDHETLTVGDLEEAVEGYKTLIEHALQ